MGKEGNGKGSGGASEAARVAVVLDAGALIAFERAGARTAGFLDEAIEGGEEIVIPASVLAQVWRGVPGPLASLTSSRDPSATPSMRQGLRRSVSASAASKKPTSPTPTATFSRYLVEVEKGESFIVTERGKEIVRLSPAGPADSPIARLVTEWGTTMPRGDLLSRVRESNTPPAVGPPSLQVLDQLREERL